MVHLCEILQNSHEVLFCFVHPHKTKIDSVVFSWNFGGSRYWRTQSSVEKQARKYKFLSNRKKRISEGFCPDSEVLVHQKIVSTQRFSLLFLWATIGATSLLCLGSEISFCFLRFDFKCWEKLGSRALPSTSLFMLRKLWPDDGRPNEQVYEYLGFFTDFEEWTENLENSFVVFVLATIIIFTWDELGYSWRAQHEPKCLFNCS